MEPQLDESGVIRLIAAMAPILRQDWVDDALCAQVGGDIAFPEGELGALEAKALCRRCGVQVECLDYALGALEPFGIWSGTSPRERRVILGLSVITPPTGVAA
jgi:WhiB family redox-sensing transcriptional regulator